MNQRATAHQAPPRKISGNKPVRTRLFMAVVLAVCLAAGGVTLFPRESLPSALKDNKLVVSAYHLRDKAIARISGGTEETVSDPAQKQQGYPTEDRKKLDAIIHKGANDR